jgi:MtN3 and saliva related transmembrane protein
MPEVFFDIIGVLAVVFTSVAFLPQAIKVFITKKTKDLSFVMLTVFFVGQIGWFIYGNLNGTLPVILSSSIQGLLTLYILIEKIRLG